MKNPNVIISSDFGPIIINVNDKYIGKSIVKEGYWAKDDIELIIKIMTRRIKKLDRSLLFYDVGSNIGTHSLAIAKTFENKVKVRAFEAQRNIFNMLAGTMAINGLMNVWCHNVAVSDGNITELEISLPDYFSKNNFGGLELITTQKSDNQNMVKDNFETVKVITLDSFEERVDFIKMDIEGMEDKAIEGAKNTISKHRPICYLEISKTNSGYIFDFFKSRKYAAYTKDLDAIFIPEEYEMNISGIPKIY